MRRPWLPLVLVAGVVAAGAYWSRGSRTVPAAIPQAAPSAQTVTEPGRLAINQALDRLYPTEADHRFAVAPKPGEGEAPLAEIVAYRASKPIPHWHYITYGLSELGKKTSTDKSLSGFGVEYTLRLVDDSDQPPAWPMNLLRWIAKSVRETREPLDPSHSTNLPNGMLDQVSPGVEGLGFLKDADLGSIETPNGAVTFVNVIPLAHREWWLLGAWDFDRYLEAVRAQQGDLLWRVRRQSVLEADGGAELLARVARDGSSQAVDYTELAWTEREIVLDAPSRQAMVKFLRYRLAYGREAAIISGDRKATFSPGDWRMECSEKACALSVPKADAARLADTLANAKRGAVVTRPHGVQFRIDSTE